MFDEQFCDSMPRSQVTKLYLLNKSSLAEVKTVTNIVEQCLQAQTA